LGHSVKIVSLGVVTASTLGNVGGTEQTRGLAAVHFAREEVGSCAREHVEDVRAGAGRGVEIVALGGVTLRAGAIVLGAGCTRWRRASFD